MASWLFAVCVALATAGQSPADGPTAPLASAATLTSIVVADIDRDGDADIVATDGALHLFVWINDGTGHLTQQRPAPPGSRATDAHGTDIGGRAPASDPSAPTDPPVFDAHVASSAGAPLAWIGLTRLGTDDCVGCVGAAARLRGPPAASPLL